MRLDHLLSRENIVGVYPWGCGAWCGCWVSHTISCGTLSPCLLVIMMVAGGGVVLCENCIVDAKSFFCLISLCCFVCVFRVAHHWIGGVFVVRAHGGCLGMSSR